MMDTDCDHPCFNPQVADTLYQVYLDWHDAGCPLDTPQWPEEIQNFLGEMVDGRVTVQSIRATPGQWKAWLNGCFVGYLARNCGFEQAMAKAEEICQRVKQ